MNFVQNKLIIKNILRYFFSKLIIISNMSSEAPPTYNFSGMNFNPDFYQSTTSDYLTLATAKNVFLTYPIAQGTETISALQTSFIQTPTPTEAFNFLDSQTANIYIGENATGTTGQIIKIGASALTTVKCGALAIKERAINNGTDASAGNIYIGDQQIGGSIYIGTGSQVIRTSGSNINIGNYSTSSGTINVGTSATTTNINGIGSIYATKFDIHDGTAVLKFGDLQTTGRLDIGSGGNRSGIGAINIGTGGSALFSINIGSTTSKTLLAGTEVSVSTKLLAPIVDTATDATDLLLGSNIVGGQIKMGGAIVNGSVFICGGNQFSGSLNIGAGSTTALNTINLGNANTTVKIPNKLVTPIIDTGTSSTTLKIGSNIIDGNIEIGGAQTTGDIIIGSSDIVGATVTVGTASTATTINGTINISTGTLCGLTAFNLITTSTHTIPTTINREYFIVIAPVSGTVTVTLPSPATKNDQIIRIRSFATVNITITTPSGSIFPCVSSGNSFTTWTAFASNTAQTFYCNGTNWYGFN